MKRQETTPPEDGEITFYSDDYDIRSRAIAHVRTVSRPLMRPVEYENVTSTYPPFPHFRLQIGLSMKKKPLSQTSQS
ncbi:hypothetical protein VN97_g8350 [Penicillium thymicola]|uniref:Uncharacterized protein n=1 Tax=Penicillium thymicola TaxID=293382 RepID=A0AAI9TDK8_PENTH|nr:hypothetical protein VN97_g8350 [Penicillium thymicola]